MVLKKFKESYLNHDGFQITVSTIYVFCSDQFNLIYVFLLKTFPDFDGQDYSYFMIFFTLRDAFSCLVLMPILSTRLQIHDAILTGISLMFEVSGYLMMPFVLEVWHFYFAQVIVFN